MKFRIYTFYLILACGGLLWNAFADDVVPDSSSSFSSSLDGNSNNTVVIMTEDPSSVNGTLSSMDGINGNFTNFTMTIISNSLNQTDSSSAIQYSFSYAYATFFLRLYSFIAWALPFNGFKAPLFVALFSRYLGDVLTAFFQYLSPNPNNLGTLGYLKLNIRRIVHLVMLVFINSYFVAYSTALPSIKSLVFLYVVSNFIFNTFGLFGTYTDKTMLTPVMRTINDILARAFLPAEVFFVGTYAAFAILRPDILYGPSSSNGGSGDITTIDPSEAFQIVRARLIDSFLVYLISVAANCELILLIPSVRAIDYISYIILILLLYNTLSTFTNNLFMNAGQDSVSMFNMFVIFWKTTVIGLPSELAFVLCLLFFYFTFGLTVYKIKAPKKRASGSSRNGGDTSKSIREEGERTPSRMGLKGSSSPPMVRSPSGMKSPTLRPSSRGPPPSALPRGRSEYNILSSSNGGNTTPRLTRSNTTTGGRKLSRIFPKSTNLTNTATEDSIGRPGSRQRMESRTPNSSSQSSSRLTRSSSVVNRSKSPTAPKVPFPRPSRAEGEPVDSSQNIQTSDDDQENIE